MYIRLSDSHYPMTEAEIRAAHPDTSFSTPFNPDGYDWVFPVPQPAYNQYIQQCIGSPPVLSIKGTWEQTWTVVDLTGEELANGLARQAEDEAKAEATRIESLWNAAHALEYANINGSAVGLVAMGILQSLPKCLAVQAWITSIWDLYYTRKANGSTDTDYSSCGDMPYSIPELMMELGV